MPCSSAPGSDALAMLVTLWAVSKSKESIYFHEGKLLTCQLIVAEIKPG